MKLLVTQTGYPPYIGGAQMYLHGLCQEFVKRHEVQVVSFWKQHRTDWLLGTTVRTPNELSYMLDGVSVTPFQFSFKQKLATLPSVLTYYIWQSRAIHQLSAMQLPHLRRIVGGEIDVVHHGRTGREPLGFASLRVAREYNAPFVLTPFHHPRWKGWWYRHYQWLYRQADVLLALTEAEADILTTFGVERERIVVTGTGAVLSDTYDVNAFRHKYKIGDAPYILFLGQKYRYKGYEAILEAAPLVWAQYPDVRFLFVGPRTRASKRVFATVSDPRIIEIGTVSLEEKTAALADCLALCVPSAQESFGTVYVEAWMLGKAVIAADIPAVRQVVTDGVDGFVGIVQPTYLADRIGLLLGNTSLQHTMGSHGRAKAHEHYSWAAIAQRTEEAYKLAQAYQKD